jgi:RNA ligase
MDGSLGILYQLPSGENKIATRGSFESEQAKVGTEILNEKYGDVLFPVNWTFLFEIIYPENRIVVDYGKTRDLVLLAGINNETGEEMSYEELQHFCDDWNVPLVKRYGMVNFDLSAVRALEEKGKEGFVIQFDHGLRVKMKFEEYVRLHKILTGVSTKTIWELLRNHQPVDQIIDKVPDEFYDWFTAKMRELKREHSAIDLACKIILSNLPDLTNAEECGILAEVAKAIQKHEYRSVLFAMWRGKPYEDIIWKMIRPKYSQPFKDTEDAS